MPLMILIVEVSGSGLDDTTVVLLGGLRLPV